MNPNGTKRYLALDGMRGVCACLVALYHFEALGVISQSALVRHADCFVDFFFVLSGFVITASYRPKLLIGMPVRDFMLLRLGRIYPLHICILILFFCSAMLEQIVGLRSQETLASSIQVILLIQIFGANALAWNSPSWSISAEMWTYVAYSFLFKLARKQLISCSICVILFGLSWVSYFGVHDFIHTAWVRAMTGFAVGSLLSLAGLTDRRLTGRRATMFEFVMLAGISGLFWFPALNSYVAEEIVFAGFIWAFAEEQGLISLALKTRPMIALGTLSYSIYMTHTFVEHGLLKLLMVAQHRFGSAIVIPIPPGFSSPSNMFLVTGPWWICDAITIAMLAVVIGLSKLTYETIELPSRRWARSRVIRLSGATRVTKHDPGVVAASPG